MDLIAWDDLEDEYRKHFSDVGRPAKDAHLVIGLLLLKQMTGLSDEALVEVVSENPSMQAFYEFTKFVTEAMLDSSTLTKIRARLGVEFFKEIERKTYNVLIERMIIRAKEMLVEAMVFPGESNYLNTLGLLNTVREWLVRSIRKMGMVVGKRPRACSRRAR